MRFPHICLLLVLAGPAIAHATDEASKHGLLNDTFRVSLGTLYAESATHARLGTSTGGSGVDVSFEDALGLDTRKLVGEVSMYWRFAQRWRVDLGYFSLNRAASRPLQADVTWGDTTFTAGTVVSSTFDLSDLRVAVGYSFFRRPDKELGVALGLHRTGVGGSLSAAGVGARSESVTAPLPVASLYGAFALTDTWALSVRGDWLSLSYDKYSGAIRSTAFDIVYQPFKNAAIGVGIHSLNLKLEVDNPSAKLGAKFALQGPAAFVSVSF